MLMITHSCSSRNTQPLHPVQIHLSAFISEIWPFTFLDIDVCSDPDQTSLYLCAAHSRYTHRHTGAALTSAAVYHEGTTTCQQSK